MKEIETKLNARIYKLNKVSNIINFLSVLFIIIFIFAFLNSFLKYEINFSIFLIFLIATLMIIGKIIYKNKVLKEIKQEVFNAILPELSKDTKFVYNPSGILKQEFVNSGIYRNYTDYYTSDGIKSVLNNIYMANVTAIRKEENRKTTVFRGVFGYTNSEEFYENEIIIKPDVENNYVRDVLDEKRKILGEYKDTVRLENSEFEKYFEVYSKDQIRARQIITSSYMEDLLKIRKEINAPIKIIYFGNKKYVAIWNMRILEEKDVLKNGIDLNAIRERVEKIYEIFKSV